MKSRLFDNIAPKITPKWHDPAQFSACLTRFWPDFIISGGQTGADLGGLLAAESLKITTGGIAPMNYRTENGDMPELGTRFGLIQAESVNYSYRTRKNVEMADVIILIARDFLSAGTRLTKEIAFQTSTPVFPVVFPTHYAVEDPNVAVDIHRWLCAHRPFVVMIAGNRESKAPGIQAWTYKLIRKIFLDCNPPDPV